MRKLEKRYIKEQRNTKKSFLPTLSDNKIIGENLSFAGSEAYKLLRTNLTFSLSGGENCKIIGVTSALRGEGKSTTAMNIAYSFAETQKRVILVEADMRIPTIVELLEIDIQQGLSHVLAGICELKEAIVNSGIHENLSVLPAGKIPPNPSELLVSDRMKDTITTLAESFDYMIVDLPPVNAVSDGLTIANLLSGMLIVVRQDYCDRYALASMIRQMEFLEVKVLGFVMNASGAPKKRYKYAYSNYGKADYKKAKKKQ